MSAGFHIYKSSAGSGKTYTLVKEYLKLILRNPDQIRHILAITFTNAAAGEMKDRIVTELENIVAWQNGNAGKQTTSLLEQMEAESEKNGETFPKERFAGNAARALSLILHGYSDFSVGTIDSFMHRVVRSFAYDLRVPPSFEIEMDRARLLDDAVDKLISQAGVDEHLTTLLTHFLNNRIEDEADLRIDHLIGKLAQTLFEENCEANLKALGSLGLADYIRIGRQLREDIRKYHLETSQNARAAIALIHSGNLDSKAFFQGNRGIYGFFQKLSNKSNDEPSPNAYVKRTVEDDAWTSAKTSPGDRQAIEGMKDRLLQYYYAITGENNSHIRMLREKREILNNIYPVGVLSMLHQIIEQNKQENTLLHISDFNKKIAAVVAKEPVPFIYERLGEKYRHYMIDEFQDTSMLQWTNLLPLLTNALAGGGLGMVVGDGKQAIYRFRDGDASQFVALPKLPGTIQSISRDEWEASLVRHHKNFPLDWNYRSYETIIDLNNRFFAYVRELLPHESRIVYEGQEQKAPGHKPGGHASFVFVGDEPSYEENMLAGIKSEVDALLGQGFRLKDITILCRRRKELRAIARYLTIRNIPVVSPDSLFLNQAEEIKFIVALLTLNSRPADRIAALEIVSFLINRKYINKPGNIHEFLFQSGLFAEKESKPLQPIIDRLLKDHGIAFDFEDFSHQNLYDCTETIIRAFFIDPEPNPYVAFFSDAVFDFSLTNKSSVADFLEWWKSNAGSYSVVIPKGVEAVQLMTIHKSKGLQFPAVIYAFAEAKASGNLRKGSWVNLDPDAFHGLQTCWIRYSNKLSDTSFEPLLVQEKEKAWLDTVNLMYVALTRPVQRLIVLTKQNKTYTSESLSGLIQGFLESCGMWHESQLRYGFGQADIIQQTDNQDTQRHPGIRKIISESWSRNLRMRSRQAEKETDLSVAGAIETGNLLHRVMEKIVTAECTDRVLDRLFENGEIDSIRRTDWKEKIHRLISQPEMAPWFSKDAIVRTEAGIYDAQGNYYKPDRVSITSEGTAVIDYKTGKPYPEHIHQIKQYALLLESMGYSNIQPYILYLDQGLLKAV